MANEKRLISLDEALKATHSEIYWTESQQAAVRNFLVKQPTVDAVVLPCKIDDDVYIIPSETNFKLNVLSGHKENNRVYHQKVANIVFVKDGWYITGSADREYGTGRILLDRYYKDTWFLTEEEAKAALAKMDGDGNG